MIYLSIYFIQINLYLIFKILFYFILFFVFLTQLLAFIRVSLVLVYGFFVFEPCICACLVGMRFSVTGGS